jgi:undecaprenyl-diphosphatase
VWLTRIGTHGLVWLVLGLLVALLWRRVAPLLLVAFAVAAADGLAAVVKLAVGEHRPDEPDPLITIPHSHSFPSGHTATSAAAATVLTVLVPARRLPFSCSPPRSPTRASTWACTSRSTWRAAR